MGINYYKLINWEEIGAEEKYNQYVRHIIAKVIKTTNTQKLVYKFVLNNFALINWPKNYVDVCSL